MIEAGDYCDSCNCVNGARALARFTFRSRTAWKMSGPHAFWMLKRREAALLAYQTRVDLLYDIQQEQNQRQAWEALSNFRCVLVLLL